MQASASVVGPSTMFHHGRPISLDSDVGALTVLHGALQSAIGSVDTARAVERTFLDEISKMDSEFDS